MRLDQNSLLCEHYRGTECGSLREPRHVSTGPTKLSIGRTRKTDATLLILSGAITNIGVSIGMIIAIVLFTAAARGQYLPVEVQPPIQIFPWGSSNNVIADAVSNSQYVAVAVEGHASNGTIVELPYINGGPYTFTNEAEINDCFHEYFAAIAQSATTNTIVDRVLPYDVVTYIFKPDWNYDQGYYYFWVNIVPFSLVYTNGAYTVPDLSGINISLLYLLSYYVPGLQWARIETYYATNMVTPFDVADSRYPYVSTNSISVSNEALTMATSVITSGNTGPYRMKLTMLMGNGFQVVDGNGLEVAETPLVLAITKLNGNVNLSVTGGDAGRVFEIEKSPDVQTWTAITGAYTVGTNAGWSITFQDTMSNVFGFYRAATTNAGPQ